MYKNCLKRIFDFILSLIALILLSPVFLLLLIIGSVQMQGNPFFTQERPGKEEKIFRLIKFRSMSNRRDKNGKLLPDEQRITEYGEFIRKTSLDELPELINILKGDMAIVGPRPLLVKYLPYYTEEEKLRHTVRPGLTGLAQINGRNNLDWDPRLALDVRYVKTLSFKNDLLIIFATILKVFRREDVATIGEFKVMDLDEARKSRNG
ncbi:MAG: sugar transferase [Erysipelotrichaceae bacterium]|nr:sugar transferase [Erysipelotrichaceae bacterium]